SLTHRHLPQSSRFPYTTLFRSRHASRLDASDSAERVREQKHERERLQQSPGGSEHRLRVAHLDVSPRQEVDDLAVMPELSEIRQDRKSTRLNSSHQIISYAVFC